MAVATKCPSCGRNVPLPKAFAGGSVSCPHADCSQVFQTQAAAPMMSKVAPTGLKPVTPHPVGARPDLLDRLPTNFLASPAMYAVGLAVALLYGMVLFGILSARKNQKEPEVSLAGVETTVAPLAPVESPPPSPTAAKPTEKPVSAKPLARAENKNPSKNTDVSKSKSDTPPTTSVVKKVEPNPKPQVEEPLVDQWGILSGPPGQTRFQVDGNELTIAIPAKLHILSPDLKSKNSPRLLTGVSGDFMAQVRVNGRILPGTQPLPNLPFTFQGAGLLIWQDENNYLRLERTASYSPAGKQHQILVENCRDGRLLPSTFRDSREADTLLRLERKGSEARCSYSPDDGKTWLEVKRQNVTFPANVQVGISASNASAKPFSARLEAFQLSGPGVKAGKGL